MLSKLEVLNITETIDKAEITYSHLRDELIDHVCCEMEYQMKEGIDFTTAFEDIKTKVGIRELQKVQEDTLLLIDKKYRIMKRVMKISGVLSLVCLTVSTLSRIYHLPGANFLMAFGFFILCVLFLPSSISIMRKENKANSKILLYISAYIGSIGFSLGIFFKVMHLPGAGILLTFGFAFLSLVFFPVLWFTLGKNITSKTEKFAVLIGIIGASIHLLGVLFKMQHWPGATILYIASIVSLIFVFLPVYSYSKFKSDVHVNEKFIYIIYGLTFFVLLTLLVQVQFAFDIEKVFQKDANTRVAVINYYDDLNNKSPIMVGDSILQSRIRFILQKVKDTQCILDSVIKKFITALAPGIIYDKSDVSLICDVMRNRWKAEIFESVMFGAGDNSPAIRVKRNLMVILGYVKQNELPDGKSSILTTLINTSVPTGKDYKSISWEDYMFRNKKPLVQYQILLSLQQRLTLAEKELMNQSK